MKETISPSLALLMILSIFDDKQDLRKDLTPTKIYELWEKAEFINGGN